MLKHFNILLNLIPLLRFMGLKYNICETIHGENIETVAFKTH